MNVVAWRSALLGLIGFCGVAAGAPPAYVQTLAFNSSLHTRFGGAMAADGDDLVVGADGAMAYLWTRQGGGSAWQLRQQIALPVGTSSSNRSIALRGEWLAIADLLSGAGQSGVVHILRKNEDGNFVLFQTLPSPTPRNNGSFGFGLAWDNDMLYVGAPNESSQGSVTGAAIDGGVHAFVLGNNPGWTHVSTVRAPNLRSQGMFGTEITIGPGFVVISEPVARVPSFSIDKGALHRCTRLKGDTLSCVEMIRPNGSSLERYGSSFAANENARFVGAPGDQVRNGLVSILDADWNVTQTILSPPDAWSWSFGQRVSATPQRLFVSTPRLCDQTQSLNGVVYFYRRIGTEWHPDGWTTMPVLPPFFQCASFGIQMTVEGDQLFASAPSYTGIQGAVFVFELPMFEDDFE